MKNRPDLPAEVEVAIVGAGFSGIAMAIVLKRAGIDDFLVCEKAGSLGGTWRDNNYPGLACDVPSHLYCYSYRTNSKWTRAYAPQLEILEYMNECADGFGVRAHIRTNTEIRDARFDAGAGKWLLRTTDGRRLTARVAVWAQGPLHKPVIPEIPGIGRCRAKVMHSAEWDHDYDFTGKRVAVIGAGASAIGVIPALASRVDRLWAFQRTRAWVMPKFDWGIGPRMRAILGRFPSLQMALRGAVYWFIELYGFCLIYDSPLNKIPETIGRLHIAARVADRRKRKVLTPSHKVGCKRTLYSDDYYSAFNRENVSLVPAGIKELSGREIVAADGERYPVDAIVFCTGFDTSFKTNLPSVEGLDGRLLAEGWAEGNVAYKGVMTHGFPNLYFLMGPNTGPGHTSVLVYVEAQVNYVLQAIQATRREGAKYLDVKEQKQRAWNEMIQRRMRGTTWLSGCTSWYLTEEGKNLTLFPGLNCEYRLRLRRFDRAACDAKSLVSDERSQPELQRGSA